MKYPERVLIVLNADGTLKGAHMEQLELFDGGHARQHSAEALTPEMLAVVLPDAAMLLAQVAAERSRVAALEVQLAGAKQIIDGQVTEIEHLRKVSV